MNPTRISSSENVVVDSGEQFRISIEDVGSVFVSGMTATVKIFPSKQTVRWQLLVENRGLERESLPDHVEPQGVIGEETDAFGEGLEAEVLGFGHKGFGVAPIVAEVSEIRCVRYYQW